MHFVRTNPLIALLALMSTAVVFSVCISDEGSGNDGDFILNTYTGADVIGGETIAFDELVARDDHPTLMNFWAGNLQRR